ncbi:MAG: Piwi domain-containing protein [Cyanobacteriota bacterium]
MIALATQPAIQDKNCLSEIFVLSHTALNLISFRLSPLTDREDGLRLSYRFSRYFPNVIVVWKEGLFYVLSKQGQTLPADAEWTGALEYIHREICEPSHPGWRFQRSRNPQETPPDIIAAFAEQILGVSQPFRPKTVYSEQSIEVKRRADFGAETVEINQMLYPAIALSPHSLITFRGTLDDFWANHPYRQNPERLLVGLKVETLDTDSTATIEEIVGTIAEYRTFLLTKASGAISRKALEEAPAEQPVVAVRFGHNSKRLYPYAMAALRPCVTAETANQLDVDFGTLLEQTKISYADRQQLLKEYSTSAKAALRPYGIQFLKAINGRDNGDLFWLPEHPIDQTPIQFGQGVTGLYNGILRGLASGGVYQRHRDYQNASERPIRLAVLNLLKPEAQVNGFMQQVRQQLDRYKFPSLELNSSIKVISVDNWNSPEGRAMLEDKLDELMTIRPDIMFVFLPQSDRSCDDDESGSLYHRIYSKLLRRQIASQFIYEETLRKETRYVLNQVMLGVLAKLGNVPFVLAEPLQVADIFIGLDVARSKKRRLSGSMNACAGVCLYGNRGEFIRAKSEDAAIEGEEIPQRFLEALLPAGALRGKTVLIYRDGRFCGEEVTHLLNWAAAIQARFILVECRKSGTARLYSLLQPIAGVRSIAAPTRGLGLKLSSHEAILVTTQVSDRIGVPRPIRLTIRPEGHPASIDQIMDATLKLTLLHHGALKPPRLPMLLHGADRLADLRLNGVYVPEYNRQFWL